MKAAKAQATFLTLEMPTVGLLGCSSTPGFLGE